MSEMTKLEHKGFKIIVINICKDLKLNTNIIEKSQIAIEKHKL